jgi:hypothetical protein
MKVYRDNSWYAMSSLLYLDNPTRLLVLSHRTNTNIYKSSKKLSLSPFIYSYIDNCHRLNEVECYTVHCTAV